MNIFVGVFKNWYFIVIFLISEFLASPSHTGCALLTLSTSFPVVGGQILIVEVEGATFQVVRIGGRDWGISLVLGALSMPIAVLVKLLPTQPFARFMIYFKLISDPNAQPLPTISPAANEQQWNEGIGKVIDNLNTFSQIRGGRLRSSSIVRKSRSRQMQEAGISPSALSTSFYFNINFPRG